MSIESRVGKMILHMIEPVVQKLKKHLVIWIEPGVGGTDADGSHVQRDMVCFEWHAEELEWDDAQKYG